MNSLITDQQQQSFDNPLTMSSGQAAKIDKMALMKAYETILRNEGILPVSDSKIYKLVFKVFQKCERTLKSNQSHLSDSLSSSKNASEIEQQIHKSLHEHQRLTKLSHTAYMYNDFRLQKKVFDGFRIMLTQQISQDKENFRPTQAKNEIDQTILKDSLNMTSKSQNCSKQQMYIGGGPNDSRLNESNHINLPRAASIGSTVFTSSRQQECKQFSFKEDLNNSLLKQGLTESNACMSGFFDKPTSSKPILPPRDSKRPQQHPNILNNNSSSDFNSQGFMRINVYPSQNSSNSNINQVPNPFQGMSMPFPHSTKHQPDYSLLDQSSINQIPAQHSFLSYSNLPDESYHPVRQPRKSSHASSGQPLKAPRINNQWSSDMNIVSSPVKEEDDYLLLVQYLRRWQKAITLIKRQREAKRRLLENLATAINFHENMLATKVLLSFIKHKVISEQERIKQLQCHQRVERNMLKFFFRMLIVKFKESRWIKSGNHMAQAFRQNIRLKKMFQSWYHIVHQNKKKILSMQHSYQANIKPAILVLDIIGSFYLNKSYYNSLDAIELLQVSKHYGRASQQFTSIAGQVVIERLKQYFSSWRQFSDRLISFKNNLLEKRARKVFRALNVKKQQVQEARERFNRIQVRHTSQAMRSLQMYTQRRLRNKHLGNNAENLHKIVVYSRYFPAWLSLHKYYSHLMKESFAKRSMARAIYLKKYLLAIKRYALVHRYKRTAIASMKRSHMFKLMSNSFSALQGFSIKSLTLRINQMRVQAKVEKRMKEGYLKAWFKRCLIEGYSFRTKEKRIKMKLFQVLKKNVSYNKLLRQIFFVSNDHYDRTLVGKAWRAIKGKLLKKYRLARIFNVIQRSKAEQYQQQAWKSLTLYKQQKIEAKAQMLNAELLRRQCLMYSNFKRLKQGLLKIKTLQIRKNNFIQQRRIKALRNMLLMMNFKAQYESDLKMREHNFIINKQFNLLRKSFYLILTSYYQKKANEQLFIERKQFRIMCLIYVNWHQYSANRANFKKNVNRFINNRIIRQLQSICQDWLQITSQRQHRHQVKTLAAVLFFKRFLTKCINAFKDNHSKQRGKKLINSKIRLIQLKRLFKAFKKIITCKINFQKVLSRKEKKLADQLFSFWYSYTQYQTVLRQRFVTFSSKRSYKALQTCFQILYENSGLGSAVSQMICQKFISQKMDCKLKQIVYAWWQYANKKQTLEKLNQRFSNKQHSKQINEIMNKWKETAYYQYFEREIFKPYLIRKQMKFITKSFNNLKQYAINRQKNRVINEEARHYYLNKKMMAGFKSLCIAVQQRQINAERMKQAYEYFGENVAKRVVNRLRAHCQISKFFKSKYEEISQDDQIRIKSNMLSSWISRFNKQQLRKSAFHKIRTVMNQVILQTALQSLNDFATYKKQKRMMKESLKAYKQHLNLIMLSQIKNRYFGYWKRRVAISLKTKCKQQREYKIKQINQLSDYLTMRKAFHCLANNILESKKQRKALGAVVSLIEQSMVKSSFLLLHHYLIRTREADHFIIKMNQKTTIKVIAAMKNYLLQQKQKNIIKVKSQAFNRIRLLKHGIQILTTNKNREIRYRNCYLQITRAYKKSLKSRTLIVLQWNRMRQMYFNNLNMKAYSKHIDIIQTKVFRHFKKLLVLKYKENQIQAIHDFNMLSKIFRQWRMVSDQYSEYSNNNSSISDD